MISRYLTTISTHSLVLSGLKKSTSHQLTINSSPLPLPLVSLCSLGMGRIKNTSSKSLFTGRSLAIAVSFSHHVTIYILHIITLGIPGYMDFVDHWVFWKNTTFWTWLYFPRQIKVWGVTISVMSARDSSPRPLDLAGLIPCPGLYLRGHERKKENNNTTSTDRMYVWFLRSGTLHISWCK